MLDTPANRAVPKLTLEQKKAAVALATLANETRPDVYHSRLEAGMRAKRNYNSFKVATMRKLYRHGLVEPISDERVQIVESGECRCGCDRWRITERGQEYVSTLKVNHAN